MTEYEHIKVTITEGNASIKYRLNGLVQSGYDELDDDVSDWTDDDIISVVSDMLDLSDEDRKLVEIIWD